MHKSQKLETAVVHCAPKLVQAAACEKERGLKDHKSPTFGKLQCVLKPCAKAENTRIS